MIKSLKNILIDKKKLNISMRKYVFIFVGMLILSVSPFVNSYFRNFSSDILLKDEGYKSIPAEKLGTYLNTCNIVDQKFTCADEFEIRSDNFSVQYVAEDYAFSEVNESETGLFLYNNLVNYNQGTNSNYKLFLKYGSDYEFGNNNEVDNKQLLAKVLINVDNLISGGQIILNILSITTVSRLLLFSGLLIFPMILKFISKFKQINLTICFKILTWTLLIVTIPYFILNIVFNSLMTINIIYIYSLGIFQLLNVLNLFVANSNDKAQRLDNQKYL